MTTQRCGTCKHFNPQFSIEDSPITGPCNYPVPDWLRFKMIDPRGGGTSGDMPQNYVTEKYGVACLTWEPKP